MSSDCSSCPKLQQTIALQRQMGLDTAREVEKAQQHRAQVQAQTEELIAEFRREKAALEAELDVLRRGALPLASRSPPLAAPPPPVVIPRPLQAVPLSLPARPLPLTPAPRGPDSWPPCPCSLATPLISLLCPFGPTSLHTKFFALSSPLS